MNDPMQEIKDALVTAALPEIPFSGWAAKVLRDAALSLGHDPSMSERAFPGGAAEAVLHWAEMADRSLAEEARGAEFAKLGLTGRIRWLVRRRLEACAKDREALRRAVMLLSLPGNVPSALRSGWNTADLMWHLAGDSTVDFSWYTKRMSLSAVFAATLTVFLSDESEGFAETWAFLDRRLAELGKLPKLIGRVRGQWDVLAEPVERMLAAAGRQNRGRHFGLRK